MSDVAPWAERMQRSRMAKAHALQVLGREFDESKHPRGQPGNAGQFGPGGSGEGSAEGGGTNESQAAPDYGFSKQELGAINAYIDDQSVIGSSDINKYMRNGFKDENGKPNKQAEAAIASMNSALKKCVLGADTSLWRGIAESKFSRDLRKDHNAEKLIGKDLPLGGFQSTSLDENVALDFVSSYSSQVILEIKAAKGTNALWMEPYAANFAWQREMLLGEGNLKVESVTRGKGSAALYITGTYDAKK